MAFTVILVEPEYSGNIGFIARTMKNFDLKDLILVNPKTEVVNSESRARSMHGLDILMNSKIVSCIEEALNGLTFVIGTTAKTTSSKSISRTCITVNEFAEKYSNSVAKTGIVFGREKNGLTNSELELCDLVVSIPASKNYSTLNLSHSAAIIFYELFKARKKTKFKTVSVTTKNNLVEKFRQLVSSSNEIKNKQDTVSSFKALLSRSPLTEKEAKSLLAVLSNLAKKLKLI